MKLKKRACPSELPDLKVRIIVQQLSNSYILHEIIVHKNNSRSLMSYWILSKYILMKTFLKPPMHGQSQMTIIMIDSQIWSLIDDW